MLEYVVLGDYQTAVGFLLASTPEKSARYYRDALCTLALAVSACACIQIAQSCVWVTPAFVLPAFPTPPAVVPMLLHHSALSVPVSHLSLHACCMICLPQEGRCKRLRWS